MSSASNCPRTDPHRPHPWTTALPNGRCRGVERPVARRAFGNANAVSRTMRMLGHRMIGYQHSTSHILPKYGPVVLLALAAHHDADLAQSGTRPGYTAAELAPFVGISAGLVGSTLRKMRDTHIVERYQASGGFRYIIAPGALVSPDPS